MIVAGWWFEWKEWSVKKMARIEGMLTEVELSWVRDVVETARWLSMVVSMARTIDGGVLMVDG